MKNEYNGYFFNEFQRENGGNNYMDASQWEPFFAKVARRIVDLFNPSMVLDAGCACGYLVAALRDLGVAAYGIDVSKYAIGKVREDVKEYCLVHSVLEPLPPCLPQTYDLVVASELLEHLFPDDGIKAIEKLCSYADTVVFSSTCQDVGDRTHVNVQLPEYWSEIFFTKSFTRNFIFDMSMLSPWCVVYEKFTDVKKVIFNYELNMRIDKLENDKNIDSTIEDIMSSLLQLESRIYFDDVSGFVEDKALIVTQMLEDSMFSVTVPIPDNTLSVRFDPIEGQYCLLKNVEIYLDNVQTTSFCTNGEFVNHYIVFNHLDPQIIVEGVQGKKEFKIVGKFQFLEDEFLQFYQVKSASIGEAVEQSKNQIALAQSSLQSIQEELDKKDGQLAEKDVLLAEKEALLAEKLDVTANQDGLLTEQESRLAEKESKLAEVEGLLAESQALVIEKNEIIGKKEEILSEKESLISQKDIALVDYAGKITVKDGVLTQNEQTIASLEEQLAEKDRLLAEKETEVVDISNSEEVQGLQKKLEEFEALEAKVKSLERFLGDKEKLLTRQKGEMEKKDQSLVETAVTIEEKDKLIVEMDEELFQKNTRIAGLQNEVQACEAVNETLTEQNKLINEHLDKVMASHEAMQNSSVWKLVAPFYKEPELEDGEDKKSKGKKDSKDGKDKKKKSGKEDKKSGKEGKGKQEEKSSKDKKKGKSEDKHGKGKKEGKGKKDGKTDGKKQAKKEVSESEEDIFLEPDQSILDDLAEIRGDSSVDSEAEDTEVVFAASVEEEDEMVTVAVAIDFEDGEEDLTVQVKSPEKMKSSDKKGVVSGKKSAEKKPLEKKAVEKKPLEKKPLEKKPLEKKPLEKKPLEKKPLEKKPVEKKASTSAPVKKVVKEGAKVENGTKVTVKPGTTVNVKTSPVKGSTVKAVPKPKENKEPKESEATEED